MGDKGKKREVGFEGQLELSKVIEYLEGVVAGLKAGTVFMRCGAEEVTLGPEKKVFLDVEGKQSGTKESLGFKLKWRKEPEAVPEEDIPLEISDKEPPPPPPEEEEEETEKQAVAASPAISAGPAKPEEPKKDEKPLKAGPTKSAPAKSTAAKGTQTT